ncbi:MAG: hypothetical protein ACKO4U_18755, partial [Caldilinea sp.]
MAPILLKREAAGSGVGAGDGLGCCQTKKLLFFALVPTFSAKSAAASRLHAKTANACSIRCTLLCLAHLSFQFASLTVPCQQPGQLRDMKDEKPCRNK